MSAWQAAWHVCRDLIVCEDGEGRMLNSYSRELVTTA
jgi:hypothetical protein